MASPLKLTACGAEETASELSCLLALPSLLLQGWWHEYQNFCCCGSDSPEGSSKKTIFGLIFLFPDPIPTLLPQAFFLKQPTRRALYCDHRVAVLATSMRRVKTQLVQSPNSLFGLVPRDLAICGRVLRDHPQAARVPEEQVCTEEGGSKAPA